MARKFKRVVLLGPNGQPLPRRGVEAKYDAAATTADNRRHWANADALSADAANSPTVRATLRNRARYEVANHCYLKGIVLTLANDTIGTGPRLQLSGLDESQTSAAETAWQTWCNAINLAAKLRVVRQALAVDGEAFILLTNNEGLPNPVKLDLRLIEADRVTTPSFSPGKNGRAVDGIRFDQWGNPSEYDVLKAHPGDTSVFATAEAEVVPAARVIHLFRMDRPEQRRGVPEITPAIPLSAQTRRYSQAVLDAAEEAARLAGWLSTDQPPSTEAPDQDENAFTSIELERNMFTVAPFGYKPQQMKAEQPTTGHKEYIEGKIGEMGRVVNMPRNIALCDSSTYNYASGRLDHQTYDRSIAVDQNFIEIGCLDRILAAWASEAVLIEGMLPQAFRMKAANWAHTWFWAARPHVDPAKEASAQETRLRNHTTTLAAEFARERKDWQAELRQRGREFALMQEIGLPLPAAGNSGADQSSGDAQDAADVSQEGDEEDA